MNTTAIADISAVPLNLPLSEPYVEPCPHGGAETHDRRDGGEHPFTGGFSRVGGILTLHHIEEGHGVKLKPGE